MDLYTCPVCSGYTELHESPLVEISDNFAGYVQCSECGSSTHEEGFEPFIPETLDDTEDLF